jgi:hypothetical protein
MRRRADKKDVNEMAHAMIEAIVAADILATMKTSDGKNPFAVALGRRGGLKGGRARADRMSASERSASAKKAAQARWTARD